MNSGWYVPRSGVEAFEAEWAAYCGADHAVGLANGLDALVLALPASMISWWSKTPPSPMARANGPAGSGTMVMSFVGAFIRARTFALWGMAGRIKMLRNCGSREKYVNEALGVNSRLDPDQAAVLRVKLHHLHHLDHRRSIAAAHE